ncbi:MAG: phosphatase PAP2 family protein [Candidatus Heimdallarchaeota archaeon]|nr:phosphatase PAP2 family protein [Candidatus Heimdallarchaeota archaeon]
MSESINYPILSPKIFYINLIIFGSIAVLGSILYFSGFNNAFVVNNSSIRFIFEIITQFGSKELYIVFFGIILFGIDFRYGKRLFMVFMSSLYLNSFLKGLLQDPRPPSNIHDGESQSSGYGFPSGHAQGSITFYGYNYFNLNHVTEKTRIHKLLIGVLIILMVLVPYSRILLGMHDLGDILGGFLIAWGMINLYLIFYPRMYLIYTSWNIKKQVFIGTSLALSTWILSIVILGVEEGSDLGMEAALLITFALCAPLETHFIQFDTTAILGIRNRLISTGIGIGIIFGFERAFSDLDEIDPSNLELTLILYFLRYFILGLVFFLLVPWILKTLHERKYI